VRERDSTAQLRLPLAEVTATIRALCDGTAAWADVAARHAPSAAVGAAASAAPPAVPSA
jgi:hypothetical protein